MWVAKVKLDGSRSLLGSITKKYNLKITGYPLSHYVKDDEIHVHLVGEVFGEERNIKKFVAELKNSEGVVKHERHGRFHILVTKREVFFSAFYNPYFIHVKPVIIDNRGFNIFELGSFDRKKLTEFIDITEEKYGSELISIKKMPIKSISIISPYPDISDRQREIFELALREGYYEFPRKVNIEKLASIKGISFSTCRAHLRKAEKKLMNFVFNFL